MSKSVQPFTWDLSELYSGPTDPQLEADLVAAETAVESFVTAWQDRTDYLCDPTALQAALDDYEQLYREVGSGQRPTYYLGLARVIDQNNAELKGLATRADERSTKLSNRLTFFELALGKITPDDQTKMLATAKLGPYHAWLKRRFEAAVHDLGEEATNALNLIVPQATDAWESLVDELLAESKAKVFDGATTRSVPFNGLPQLLSSPDSRVVKEAGAAMTRIMRRLAPVAEREINAIVTTNLRLSRLERYDRPDAGRFRRDGLDATVAEAMLNAIEQQYSLSQRFYRLKARLLGRQQLAYHERVSSYGQLPSGYTFEQGVGIVRGTLGRLHPSFAIEFDHALQGGHIDALPRPGKQGGAACWHNLIGHPTYLMLNFSGQVGDIETLGHEFGHYLNNLAMQASCDSLSFGAATPMAEVASTFFEAFVLEDVVGQVDDETRLALMVSHLDGEVATIFRQAAAMRFEQALYQAIDTEGYLSYQQIGKLFARHMSAYLGDTVSMANGANLWWIYWGHFRAGFYNYSYSFALLVAKALQARVAADPAYIDQFRRLLACGRQQTPRDLLASMNLDISGQDVWKLGLGQITTSLDEVETLARQLGKL